MLIEELGPKGSKIGDKLGEYSDRNSIAEECKQVTGDNSISRNAKQATGFNKL